MGPLHAGPSGVDLPLVVVLATAGAGSALLLGLGLAALVRRRSRPYLLIALALSTLLARTALAGIALVDALPAADHHLAEHVLDVAMVVLVVGAVYYARGVTPEA